MLAAAWCSSSNNFLLLPESGPLTASWLQQCCDMSSLPPAHSWQWLVQYAPLVCPAAALEGALGSSGSNGGCNGSSSSNGSDCGSSSMGCAQGGLTAGELLAVLHAGDTCAQGAGGSVRGVNGAAADVVGGVGGPVCEVVGCDSDLRKLKAAVEAHG